MEKRLLVACAVLAAVLGLTGILWTAYDCPPLRLVLAYGRPGPRRLGASEMIVDGVRYRQVEGGYEYRLVAFESYGYRDGSGNLRRCVEEPVWAWVEEPPFRVSEVYAIPIPPALRVTEDDAPEDWLRALRAIEALVRARCDALARSNGGTFRLPGRTERGFCRSDRKILGASEYRYRLVWFPHGEPEDPYWRPEWDPGPFTLP